MGIMAPTENLEREHRHIEKVVKACLAVSEELDGGGTLDAGLLKRIVDFFRTYADACHHGKEEAQLFPALYKHGVPISGCPIGGLSAEHVQGRHLVTGLAEGLGLLAGDRIQAQKTVLESLRGINRLYPNHIWKEDYLLFPMTLKVLNGEELAGLGEKFKKVELAVGPEALRACEEFADTLESRWRATG